MNSSLSDLTVLDLSRALSGPYCTMALGDLGARVIKVEPLPDGDMSRQWGPIDRDISVYFLSANRNKEDVAVDFRKPEGLALVRELALKADVVVENFRVGTMEKMGLGYDALAAQNPKLIMASISGFGRTGPARNWAGFDQIAQGYSGFMSLTGTPESGPTRVGVPLGDMVAGLWLTIGILSALHQRARTGRGQHVDVSLLAGLMSLLTVQAQRYLNLGEVPQPKGNAHPTIAPYGTFQTADGPINLAPATEGMWKKLCELLGAPELVRDPRFADNAGRMKNGAALKALLEAGLKAHTRAEWTEIFIRDGIPAGPINTMKDVFVEPQVAAAGLVERVLHPILGELAHVGLPLRFSADPEQRSVRTAAPALGANTHDVLHALGITAERLAELERDGVINAPAA